MNNRNARSFNRLLLLCAFIFLLGCNKNAGRDALNSRAWLIEKTIGPLIVNLEPSRIIEEQFLVQNPSVDQVMNLKLQERSCSCLDCSIDPSSVPPLGQSTITIRTFIPHSTSDNCLRLRLSTDLFEKPDLEICLTIKARPILEVLPSELPLVQVPWKQSASSSFEVLAHQKEQENPLPINIGCNKPNIRLETLKKTVSIDSGIRETRLSCRAIITAFPGLETTATRGQAAVRARLGAASLTREIRWFNQQFITCDASDLFLHTKPASKSEKKAVIKSKELFSILEIVSNSRFLQCDYTRNRSSLEHAITIVFNAPEKPAQAYHGLLTITTDCDHQPEVKLPVHILCSFPPSTR